MPLKKSAGTQLRFQLELLAATVKAGSRLVSQKWENYRQVSYNLLAFAEPFSVSTAPGADAKGNILHFCSIQTSS